MAKVAVLGMGLLGRGFAENLLTKGHEVRVYNRTASKCAPVVEAGAIHAATPADAVRGADRVHLILTADDAVDTVIAALRDGLGEGVFIVDHSTNLPARVTERFERLRGEGVRYIHAPVFMGPQNSKDATGLMLIAGPTADVDILRPILEDMTGKLLAVGDDPSRAATFKISGNGLLMLLIAGMGDLFKICDSNGIAPEELLELFDSFGPTAAGMGRRILRSSDGNVGFELTMARKDVGLMMTAAGDGLNVLPAIASAMDDAIEAGRGSEDFTAFVRPN